MSFLKKKKSVFNIFDEVSLLGDFTLCFTPIEAYVKHKLNTEVQSMPRVLKKGAFHPSLTVLICYRFPLHIYGFAKNKHQYLAFDV